MKLPLEKRKNFTKLRVSAHDLKIEMGRYNGTQVINRSCNYCENSQLEDEFHFMLDCTKYDSFRTTLYSELGTYHINSMPYEQKFYSLMTGFNGNPSAIKHVINFVNASFAARVTV